MAHFPHLIVGQTTQNPELITQNSELPQTGGVLSQRERGILGAVQSGMRNPDDNIHDTGHNRSSSGQVMMKLTPCQI
jgi:hypothetical protein